MNRNKLWSVLAFAVLTGCGGGGGGGGGDPPAGRATVSGTVVAAENVQVDSDTNDPMSEQVRNNSAATAQNLPNQFRLGGYVNQPGAGPAGPLQAGGDVSDIFELSLAQGQFVNLFIGDVAAPNDLDLFLYDGNGQPVAESVSGDSNVESVAVPAAGTWFVEVRAFAGASAYVLAPGTSAAAQHAMRSDADLVPGELIVRFEDGAPAPKSALAGLVQVAGIEGQAGLYRLAGTPAKSLTAGTDDPVLQGKFDTLAAAKAIAQQAGVRYAEPPLRRRASRVPNDPGFASQWHYPQIKLPEAWDVTVGSSNVTVAVLDTGVLVNHPDLAANLDNGNSFDFISNAGTGNDGDGIDTNADDAGDRSNPDGGASFHGTHCAGVVAAASDNGIGVAGVTWNSRIMNLRVLGVGGGTNFDIGQAMLYAARLPNASGRLPTKRADILSMSLGGGDFSSVDQDIVNQVRAAGVIVVAAAGNSGNSSQEFPASYDGVVSVAATTITGARARYSQFNSRVDVAAPGGDTSTDLNGDGIDDGVLSTFGTGAPGRRDFEFSFAPQNGTSMATPHVAGVIALMKAVYPQLTPDEFDTLLANGDLTDDRGTPGRDNLFGHGQINAAKAVAAAQELANDPGTPIPPRLVLSPASVNLGATRTSVLIAASASREGPLAVTSISDDQPWLTVTADTVDASGLGHYRINVNRAALPTTPGVYRGNVTFVSAANTVIVPVTVEVAAPGTSVVPNAGFHYVLLLDADSDVTQGVQQFEVAPVNGRYPFSFTRVADGRYFIVAGSDGDNDGVICDEGEACGVFPIDDGREPITVSNGMVTVGGEPIADIELTSGYEIGVVADGVSLSKGRGYRRR